MTDNTNQQQTTDATPAGTGGKLFTQDEVNKIVSDRLAREREKLADGSEYKAKYEAVQKELEGMKAAQLHQKKESAYRDLLAKANIYDKRIATVIKASAAEIDALELDETGKAVGADKLVEAIKTEWADFVVTIPHSVRVRREPRLLAVSSLWRACALSVLHWGHILVPQVRPVELSKPAGNQKRLYVLL